jgi:hypothetical protein
MLTGIGIFSAMTSYLSTMFINRRKRDVEGDTGDQNEILLQRLAAIEDQLTVLANKIDKQLGQDD